MLNIRTHTIYLKNLNNNHPLKQLYKKTNSKNYIKYINNYKNWKHENILYSDKYITNTHIIFD